MLEMVLAKIEEIFGEWCSVEVDSDGDIQLCVEDFGGFDEDWEEIMIDYDEEALDRLCAWLEEHGEYHPCDMYPYYQFDGFAVQLSFASYDI